MRTALFDWIKIKTLFGKEFRLFFFSPVSAIFICIFLIVLGWLFFSRFFLYNQLELRDFFNLLPMVLAFVVPALTMGLFSEEFSTGSYELISTTSVTLLDIIIGKFLAATAFTAIALLPTVLYPITLSFLGELDLGPVIGGYIGSFFLIGALTSIGLLASSLSRSQVVSFIIALAASIFLCLILSLMKSITPPFLVGLLEYISADYHFGNIAKGILDVKDIVYFLTIIFICLYSSRLVLEQRK